MSTAKMTNNIRRRVVSLAAVLFTGAAAACTNGGSGPGNGAGLDFEPVYLEDPAGGLRASIIGRRDGGFFGESAASTPPAYDPDEQRIYVIAAPRFAVEVLDISDPARPRLVDSFGYLQFLRALFPGFEVRGPAAAIEALEEGEIEERLPRLIGELRSLAFADGGLAIAFDALQPNERGRVIFLDEDGDPAADAVSVGIEPDSIAFTPDGQKLVVTNTGNGEPGDDPEASISVVDVIRDPEGDIETDQRRIGFTAFNDQADELRAQGVRLITPGYTVSQDLEPESLTISEDGSTAYVAFVRNNAFATVDLDAEEITTIHGLGTRDLNISGQGLDASDRDDAINIRPWPVHGYFSPDGIGVYPGAGAELIVTANEGDPRDFEDARVAELTLDPDAFPGAADLQRPENLGRLRITNAEGDSDGDGDFDRLFTLGTRSFAIWTTDGDPVFDSGDAFERKTAEAVPAFFNTSDERNQFDNRSADRGPEPEPLALGEVAGRWYAFIGFERISGIIAYDITEPAAPAFAFYLNNRNFALDPRDVCESGEPKSEQCAQVGDIETESLLVIPASESPNGSPLLVATHEQTDSLTLIELAPLPGT